MNMSSSSKTDDAYRMILDDVLEGHFNRIPIFSENDLITKYEISRSTIREALIKLCNDNVFRVLPRRGYQLVPITEAELKNALEYRQILEASCLKMIIPKLSSSELMELESFYESHCNYSGDESIWDIWEKNCAFHLKLISYMENEYIYQCLKNVLNYLRRSHAQVYNKNIKFLKLSSGCESHKKILLSILDKNSPAAIQALLVDLALIQEKPNKDIRKLFL